MGGGRKGLTRGGKGGQRVDTGRLREEGGGRTPMTKTVEVNEGEGMYGDSLGIQIEMGWGKDMI